MSNPLPTVVFQPASLKNRCLDLPVINIHAAAGPPKFLRSGTVTNHWVFWLTIAEPPTTVPTAVPSQSPQTPTMAKSGSPAASPSSNSSSKSFIQPAVPEFHITKSTAFQESSGTNTGVVASPSSSDKPHISLITAGLAGVRSQTPKSQRSIILDMAPTGGPGEITYTCHKGQLLVSEVPHWIPCFSSEISYSAVLDVRAGLTVRDVINTLKAARYDRYEFTEDKQGGRYWMGGAIGCLERNGITTDSDQVIELCDMLDQAYDVNGANIESSLVMGMYY